MDLNLVSLVLVAVAFATVLNLWMTFRLAVRMRDLAAPAMTVPIGGPVPPFEGTAEGHILRSSNLAGRPSVLVFLSAGCKTCAGHVGELVELLPGATRAGVSLWIVPADDVYDIAGLVGETPLTGHLLFLEEAARLRLNPLKVVPFYLFVDDALQVRASNYLGDEDWIAFVNEMRGSAG
jgi:AhpC/TSA family